MSEAVALVRSVISRNERTAFGKVIRCMGSGRKLKIIAEREKNSGWKDAINQGIKGPKSRGTIKSIIS